MQANLLSEWQPTRQPHKQTPCRLGTIDYIAPEILDCPVKLRPEDHKSNPQVGRVGVLAVFCRPEAAHAAASPAQHTRETQYKTCMPVLRFVKGSAIRGASLEALA